MGILSPYLQERRDNAVKRYLKGDILDIGCGTARLIKFLKEDQDYVGVDIYEKFIERLNKKYEKYRFFLRDIEKDPLNLDKKFDTVLMISVIEHLRDPTYVLNEIKKYIKKNGILIIITPTPLGIKIHNIGARLGLFHDPAKIRHYSTYSYGDMETLARATGYRITCYKKFEFGLNQLFILKVKYDQ